MTDHQNYRTLSQGELKVYGNSIEIRESFFHVSRDQNRVQTKKEIQSSFETIEKLNEQWDKLFLEHVLKYGKDFHNYPLRPFETEKKEKPEPPKRERGDIIGFSKKSRLRLLKKLNQTNPDNTSQVFHITLTYPKRYPDDGTTHKADLDAFIKRIKRRFTDEIAYLWKLEFQKRGAPHYHIILYLPKEYKVGYLRKWFSQNWYEVVQRYWQEKLENHRNAGVSCDKVNSLRLAGSYLSKYISKDEGETPKNQGRYWGCSRNWGDVILNCAKLTGKQLIQFRRLVKRFLKDNSRMQKLITRPSNLVVFGHWSFFIQAIDWVKQTH